MMLQDKKFYFMVETEVENELGGTDLVFGKGESFYAYSSPVRVDVVLREHGIVTKKASRLISDDEINMPIPSLIISDDNGNEYKIIQHLAYSTHIFLIEEVN